MELREALEVLADGHAVLSEEEAREVCMVLGVPFPEGLVMQWQSTEDALSRYGFVPFEDAPGRGVWSLRLSYHVARRLGLEAPGNAYMGRGRQARANATAIARHFGLSLAF
jgi:hypothetical protein